MPHNSPAHRDAMRKLHVYVACAMWLKNTGWTQAELGHIAVDKATNAPLAAIVVGKVNGARLNCGPAGSFIEKFNNFEKAKFNFLLDCPDEPAYAEDWERTLATLDRAQQSIAYTKDRRNLIEPLTKSLRFGAPIFEKRDVPLRAPGNDNNTRRAVVYDGDYEVMNEKVRNAREEAEREKEAVSRMLEANRAKKAANGDTSDGSSGTLDETGNTNGESSGSTTIDEETDGWPVPVELQDAFDAIKYTYKVNPLPVYRNDVFVEPLLVNKALKGALVEVHFNIRHFKIEEHDSFTAIPLQVIILKDGPPETNSPYKRKNLRDGPVRPKEFSSSTNASTPALVHGTPTMAPAVAANSARNASPSASGGATSAQNAGPSTSGTHSGGTESLGGPFIHVDSPVSPPRPVVEPIVEQGDTPARPGPGSNGDVGTLNPTGASSGADGQGALGKRKAAATSATTTRATAAAGAQNKGKPASAT